MKEKFLNGAPSIHIILMNVIFVLKARMLGSQHKACLGTKLLVKSLLSVNIGYGKQRVSVNTSMIYRKKVRLGYGT